MNRDKFTASDTQWLRDIQVLDKKGGHSWASSRKVLSFAVRKAHIDLHLK